MLQLNIFLGGKEACEMWEKMTEKENTGGRFHLDRVATLEKSHCQSMKGSFPRDCLISAYLHLLATHSHGRADAEVYGHTGRSSINHLGENISAGIPSKISRRTWSSICSVGAGLCGISSFFMNLMVILCLNIYPQFIVSGIQTLYFKLPSVPLIT